VAAVAQLISCAVAPQRGNLLEEVCTQQKVPADMVAQFSLEQLEAIRMIFTLRRYHRYDERDRRIETSSTMASND
jgi:hypothetical protein